MEKVGIPLSDEHLRCIGKVSANFALLEEMVAFCIWSLIGNEQRLGQIITVELSFRQKVALFSSLYRYRVNSSEEPAELKQLLDRATQAEEKRNAIIHALWGTGGAKETVTRFKATAKRASGLKFVSQEMSVQDLDGVADFIAEVVSDVLKFLTYKVFKKDFAPPF